MHVGLRLQATVVLGCPGLDLTGLLAYRTSQSRDEPVGLAEELAAARARAAWARPDRLRVGARDHRRIVRTLVRDGRWTDEQEVRARLRGRLPWPEAGNFPVPEPPPADEGLEGLPLFFDGRPGPVAIAAALGGWELLELRAAGGIERSLGVIPAPDRPPPLHATGRELLEAYLRYWLERDALFGTALLAAAQAGDGSVEEWVAEDLRAIGALVLARADVRARGRRGDPGPLTADDIADGIRASDLELLDRPTWGDRL